MKKTMLLLGSTLLAVALAGCGSSGGSSVGSSPTVDPEDQALKFVQCMRRHGIAMEDPKPGGGMRMEVNKGNEAKMQAAQKACEKFSPVRRGDAKQQAEDLDRMTKMAKCLRRNGIPVEDPKPGQPFTLKTTKGNAEKTDKAMKTCSAEVGLPGPENADGGGSGPSDGSTESGSAGSGGSASLEADRRCDAEDCCEPGWR